MSKVYFRNNDSAHDFAQRIGTHVNIEEAGKTPEQQTYSVDTDNASYGKDDPYGDNPDAKRPD